MSTKFFFEILWILLPAGVANMAPIFAAKIIPSWSYPADFGFTWRETRIFGSHKTIRGLFAEAISGGLVFLVLRYITPNLISEKSQPQSAYLQVPIYLGFWIGFCALAGDLLKSFLKRRLGIAPGKAWAPFDQVDWALGSALGALLYLPF